MTVFNEIYLELSMSTVFRSVIKKPLFESFFKFVKSGEDEAERISAYAEFVSEIYKSGASLTDLVARFVFEDENVYVKAHPCANFALWMILPRRFSIFSVTINYTKSR